MTEVAQQAGVSVATVSHVLNEKPGRVSAATAARVRGVIDELGYRPSGAASTLKSRQSRLVAVLIANAANPTMAAIAASIETAARRRNLLMVLSDTHEDPALQDEHLLTMEAQLARALVLVATVKSPALARMGNAGAPLVFVGRRSPAPGWGPYVGIDNRAAAEDVASHLSNRGKLPTAILHGSPTSSAVVDRVRAFSEALPASAILRERGADPGRDHLSFGYQAMGELLRLADRPRSVFCTSDLIAYGAHARCRDDGVAVPAEIALVGFDDNPLNDWLAPWLSSVRVPYEQFGEAALDALEQRASGGTASGEILLPHQFVARW